MAEAAITIGKMGLVGSFFQRVMLLHISSILNFKVTVQESVKLTADMCLYLNDVLM